jgi:hypothetical protein
MFRSQILESRGVNLEGRIVDKDVQAPEPFDRPRDGPLAEFLPGNITRDQYASPAFGFDLFLGELRIFVLVELYDRNVGAFTGKEYRDGSADT